MQLPSAIIFVNNEISDQQKEILSQQLRLTETISGTEFNSRVEADSNYPDVVRSQNFRILVIQENYGDTTNRNLADVVIFVKQGLASVEKNNFGPPNFTFDIQRSNIWSLLRSVGSDQVVILNNYNNFNVIKECDYSNNQYKGIFAIQMGSSSTICKNPDSESNNIDFINRK